MNKSVTTQLGVYQFDYRSIKNQIKGVAALTSETGRSNTPPVHNQAVKRPLNSGEAELWQFNQVVQKGKREYPDAEFVLHAERIKDGTKTEQIRLYCRPKPECENTGFLAKMQSKREQRLAAEVIATLASTFRGSSGDLTASRPKLAASLDFLTKPSASLTTSLLAEHLHNVAASIEAAKLGNSKKPVLAKRADVRNKLNEELNEFYAGNIPNITLKQTLQDLAPFNFNSREIKAFQELVSNVKNGRESGEEDLYAIERFRMQWIAINDSGTVEGKRFRDFIQDNPQYHALSVVAYRLGNRPSPMFDLSLYGSFDVVMLPIIEEMQPLINYAEQMIVSELCANSAPYAAIRFKGGNWKRRTLVAAKCCVIAPEQTQLLENQKAHLLKTYKKVIAEYGEKDKKVILTPLFNYTESTIDECVKIMLRSVKQAWEEEKEAGKRNLEVEIFSSDPRISKKFQEARRNLQTEIAEKKNKKTNANVEFPARDYIVSDPQPNEPSVDTPLVQGRATDGIAQGFLNGVEDLKQHVSMVVHSIPLDTWTAVARESVEDVQNQFQKIGLPQHEEAGKMGSNTVDPETLQTAEKTDQTLDGNLPTALNVNRALGEYDSAQLSSAVREQLEKLRMEPESLQANPTTRRRKVEKFKRVVREASITGIAATSVLPVEIEKINRLMGKQGIEQIKLQIGLMEHDWLPDEHTVLLLTKSAMECIQPSQMHLKPQLEAVLNDEGFSTFTDLKSIFRPHNLSPGKHLNRYIAPAKHLSISGGLLLSDLQERQAEGIRRTYEAAVEAAQEIGFHKMVLTPCFSTPGTGNENPCKQAIAIMLKTLEKLHARFPELDITLVARSETEYALMEDAIETLRKQKRN